MPRGIQAFRESLGFEVQIESREGMKVGISISPREHKRREQSWTAINWPDIDCRVERKGWIDSAVLRVDVKKNKK